MLFFDRRTVPLTECSGIRLRLFAQKQGTGDTDRVLPSPISAGLSCGPRDGHSIVRSAGGLIGANAKDGFVLDTGRVLVEPSSGPLLEPKQRRDGTRYAEARWPNAPTEDVGHFYSTSEVRDWIANSAIEYLWQRAGL
jgi:hypothetical protein